MLFGRIGQVLLRSVVWSNKNWGWNLEKIWDGNVSVSIINEARGVIQC